MQIDLERFKATFFEEAGEHLVTMEAGLLRLHETGADEELLHTIFRSAHSIKGASGSFGFTALAQLTHVMEHVLDQLRSRARAADRETLDLLLRANDILRDLLEATRAGQPERVASGPVRAELERLLEQAHEPAAADPTPRVVGGIAREVRIRFEPARDFFFQGQDPLLLVRDLAALGEVLSVQCDTSALPPLDRLDPERCHIAWEMRLRTDADLAELRAVFLFVEEACRLEVDEVRAADGVAPRAASVSGAPSTPAARILAGSPADRRSQPERRAEASTLRVPTEKVDALINLVGELVIAQAMVNQAMSGAITSPELDEAMALVQRTTRELQEQTMAVRMLPVGAVFHRFPRLVHDLASQLGKQVRLEIHGAETELDKSVIEALGDPLTHLIRNAVDHGLETPERRTASGKPEAGVVTLRAYHEGGSVIIEVADDGHGLDADRIRGKAVAQGLVRADAVLGDSEVHALIFAPGFSTAQVVSDVSGRGVGMDVVKRNVEGLNGSITVHSARGMGSRFRIRLPLTLAILDGLSVQVGGEVFIVPLLAIRQSVRPHADNLRTVLGGRGELFLLRGEQLPLVRLAHLFHLTGAVEDPTRGIVVVAESDGAACGLLVDDVLGQQQVVVKNIERNYRRIEAIMGATILGDGRVAFIVDVAEMLRLAARRRHEGGGEGVHVAAGAAQEVA